jgi:hypothetical protein
MFPQLKSSGRRICWPWQPPPTKFALATFRRKIARSKSAIRLLRPSDSACMYDFCRSRPSRVAAVGMSSRLQCQATTDLDDVVCDHPKANPALHAFEPSISTAIQSVAPLQHADAAFASGPPALPSSEPTRSLQFSPLAAFGAGTRHRDSRHAHSLNGLLIL